MNQQPWATGTVCPCGQEKKVGRRSCDDCTSEAENGPRGARARELAEQGVDVACAGAGRRPRIVHGGSSVLSATPVPLVAVRRTLASRSLPSRLGALSTQ